MHRELHETPLKIGSEIIDIDEIWKKSKIFIIFSP